MTLIYEVQPASGPLSTTIRPPGSKSITNRALVCAALTDGPCVLSGVLESDDTRVMVDSLLRVGIAVEALSPDRLVVHGAGGGIPALEAELYIGNSGTTVRFLTAMLTLGHGSFTLDGASRMRERPIGDLVDALAALGARVDTGSPGRCPPVTVHANGLLGGEASVRGDISSQYLSGLMMAAPCARSPVALRIDGPLVSRPYVDMTTQVMRAFGAEVLFRESNSRFEIANCGYRATDYTIEPDASAASYFWAAAAIVGGSVMVEGLHRGSLQGDVRFVECLEEMGCEVEWLGDAVRVTGRPLRGVSVDMNAISDTAQTLAAVALFADGPTTITGIGHNRHKETDRIGDLATELRKLGALVEELDDGFQVTPAQLRAATIETYDDHRMAMSLALVGLRVPGVRILNPACTSKTYPNFFEDLERVTLGRSRPI